ncbi:hypothetical protein ES703_44687 [subsurface metagenome]
MAEERRAVRATLEDVLSNQGTLYDLLGELVREEERHKFIDYVARALMGQGTGVKMDKEFSRIVDTELPGEADIENVEDALRFMTLLTSSVFHDGAEGEYEIRELWRAVRKSVLRVFPLAIKAAAAMSTEQWYRRGGTPPDNV